MVATTDGHFVKKDDARAHEALLAIQTKTTLSDPDRFRFQCDEFYVKTPDEMARAVSELEYPGALANTLWVAERCTLELPIGDRRICQMPVIEVPEGRSLPEQLRVQTYQGLAARNPAHIDERLWRAYLATAEDTDGAAGSAGAGRASAGSLDDVLRRLGRRAARSCSPA